MRMDMDMDMGNKDKVRKDSKGDKAPRNTLLPLHAHDPSDLPLPNC